jgi:hypothetical protein
MTIATPLREDRTLAATHRAVWASGDYALMAEEVMAPLGPILVAATGIAPGQRVLEIAAGSGNISLPAAQAGGIVVSTDLTRSCCIGLASGPRNWGYSCTGNRPTRTPCRSTTANSTPLFRRSA